MSRIRVRGILEEIQRGGQFVVALQDTPEYKVRAYLSGRMKINKISLVVGDDVDVELSKYDLTRGRIIYRHNQKH